MKWYDQILASVKNLLGLESEATEAEVHAALKDTGSREALATSIRAELNAEHTAAIAAMQTQLDAANASLAASQASNATLTTQVATLTTENATLKAQPAAERSTGKREEEGGGEKKLSAMTASAIKNMSPKSSLPKW